MQPCQLSVLVQAVTTRWAVARRMCRRGRGELEHEKTDEVCRAFAVCIHGGLLFEAPLSCYTIDPQFPDNAAASTWRLQIIRCSCFRRGSSLRNHLRPRRSSTPDSVSSSTLQYRSGCIAGLIFSVPLDTSPNHRSIVCEFHFVSICALDCGTIPSKTRG